MLVRKEAVGPSYRDYWHISDDQHTVQISSGTARAGAIASHSHTNAN